MCSAPPKTLALSRFLHPVLFLQIGTMLAHYRSLGLKPSTSLTFKWENEGDVPKAVLSATNAGGYYIAYKVKTTKPKRYVVRPPQGIVLPDGTADIQLTMVPGDASSLWAEAVDRSRSNGECFPVCNVFRCLYVC
jgi:hypothetical protein